MACSDRLFGVASRSQGRAVDNLQRVVSLGQYSSGRRSPSKTKHISRLVLLRRARWMRHYGVWAVIWSTVGAAVLSMSWLWYCGALIRTMERGDVWINRRMIQAGLTLQTVYVEGQSHVQKEQIIEALGVHIGHPILRISLDDIKKRLESYDWIRYAAVNRQLPGTLHVRIMERVPVAVWQHQGAFHLLDAEGSIIHEPNLEPLRELVLVVGEAAPLYAGPLLQVLHKDEALFGQVASAIRVSERRWNVRFRNGLEVKLPEKNIQDSWHYVCMLYHEHKLFREGIQTIDLRIPGKLYIKKMSS